MLIENELYDKIREVLPTVCVDLLVTNEQKQYLLAKRIEKPAKGSWWFPGGRIHKGETWQECAKRKGRDGEFILHQGNYIFRNASIVLGQEPQDIFLKPDTAAVSTTATVAGEKVDTLTGEIFS